MGTRRDVVQKRRTADGYGGSGRLDCGLSAAMGGKHGKSWKCKENSQST